MRNRFKIALSAALLAGTCWASPALAEGEPAQAAEPAVADPLAPTAGWSIYAHGNAPLPPMGWNSWNAFTSDIDETKLMASAQIIVDSGLAAKGYRYIDIDDGWWLKRRESDGRMMIAVQNFPSAVTADGNGSFRPLTDRLHAMGLKAGIYSDMGRNSCGQVFTSTFPNQPVGNVAEREVGLYDHIDKDIRLYFEEWGFDLIKVDACGIRALPPTDPKVVSGQYRALGPLIDVDRLENTDIAAVRALYEKVGDALERYNPDDDFVFSLCMWGSADVRAWAKEVGNMSRTSEDISANWGRMLHNLDSTSRRELYAHPGSWNDPDMLFIGQGQFDQDHITEARSHMGLWAMVNAPLMIGLDLRDAPQPIMDILGNAGVIALNQDAAGNQAVLAYDSDDVQIFVKTLADGEKGVAVFNRTAAPLEATLTADHLKFARDAGVSLTDLWTGATSGFTGDLKLALQPHQTALFRASGTRRLADGMYLSEMPARVNPAVDGVVVPEVDPLVHRAPLPWRGTRGNGEPPQYGGWGGARIDTTPFGDHLSIGGKGFDTGIGILANSRVEIQNDGASRFTASVGVDDSARARDASVTFIVYADGKQVAQSIPMRAGDMAQDIVADIAGARIVELVARADKAQRFPDPVTWGDAALMD